MNPVSDMLIRIKNAQKAGHETAQVSYSKLKHEIANVLRDSGFIKNAERKGKKIKRTLEMGLLYKDGLPAVAGVRLISKPSRRLYASYKGFSSSPRGGIIIVSTPAGVMTATEAKKAKVGGELIAEIW